MGYFHSYRILTNGSIFPTNFLLITIPISENKFLLFYLSQIKDVFFKTNFQLVEFFKRPEILLLTAENVAS